MSLASVDLPDPLAPMIEIFGSASVRLTGCRIVRSPSMVGAETAASWNSITL